MEVARPRGIGPLAVEHAQALTYLALEGLYDAMRAKTASDDLWDNVFSSIRTWRRLLTS